MKILYAIQATGNGHISRAIEITPHLQKHGEVSVFMSGTQSDITFPHPIKDQKYGLSFTFGKKGGVDVLATFRSMKPLRLFFDIQKTRLNEYDVIINDFEPITAWACKLRGRNCISLSHQASFLSTKTPRPKSVSKAAELVFDHFAPSNKYIGLHYQAYDQHIRTPIIRSSIRELKVTSCEHINVYLPSYGLDYLYSQLSKVQDIQFKVFSRHCDNIHKRANIEFYPTGNRAWLESLASCHGLIIGAGFEGPSEALYLGKKLLVIPMKNQYEQRCNATALSQLGVWVEEYADQHLHTKIKHWLNTGRVIKMDYPEHSEVLVKDLLNMAS